MSLLQLALVALVLPSSYGHVSAQVASPLRQFAHRFTARPGETAYVHFGTYVRGREGHNPLAPFGWTALGRYIAYDEGPAPFVVQSTSGVGQTALCTLEGSSKLPPDADADGRADPGTAFTIFADHAGRLKMHNCGCSKGFRVKCHILGSAGLTMEGERQSVQAADEGIECMSWADPEEPCPEPYLPLAR